MPMFWMDWTFILVIPALLFAMWAQFRVKSTYSKYARVGTRSGITGADVARHILRDADVDGVDLEVVPGQLSDHYDPRSRTLRLSQDVYSGQSVAALGIAAHEVGHAIQHARHYAPMHLRSVVYPASSIGSTLAFPLFFIGFFVGKPFMIAGIVLFACAVAFTLITLPVEFNASNRAVRALASGGYLTDDELRGARRVLGAAALTYVAAAAMAIMQLLRLILIAQSRD